MLRVNPKDRITLTQVKQHKWFTGAQKKPTLSIHNVCCFAIFTMLVAIDAQGKGKNNRQLECAAKSARECFAIRGRHSCFEMYQTSTQYK